MRNIQLGGIIGIDQADMHTCAVPSSSVEEEEKP